MHVVVGLGNPGRRYAATRHNVGFMVIEELAQRWGVPLHAGPHVALGETRRADAPVALALPQRYMNRSGEALATLDWPAAAEWIVVHDDLDLPCGRLRVKRGGGAAGHRGIESIGAWRGTDFTRVRVGIGRPVGDEPVVDYVLAPFAADQLPAMSEAIPRAADAIETVIAEGLTKAMNRFNQRGTSEPSLN